MLKRYLILIGSLVCGLAGFSASSVAAESCPGGGSPTNCKAHCTIANPPVCTEQCDCAITGKPAFGTINVSRFTARSRTGTITGIDLASKKFTCNWQGKEWTYQLTDKTSFQVGLKGEEPGTVSDLKLGGTVLVAYHNESNADIADQVTITKQ
jgi:hypothetical protein